MGFFVPGFERLYSALTSPDSFQDLMITRLGFLVPEFERLYSALALPDSFEDLMITGLVFWFPDLRDSIVPLSY